MDEGPEAQKHRGTWVPHREEEEEEGLDHARQPPSFPRASIPSCKSRRPPPSLDVRNTFCLQIYTATQEELNRPTHRSPAGSAAAQRVVQGPEIAGRPSSENVTNVCVYMGLMSDAYRGLATSNDCGVKGNICS